MPRQPREADLREARRLERKARRQNEARQRIVDAARRVLREHGIQGFTIDLVAEAVGISKPSVHYYFGSKEHLVGAVIVAIALEEMDASHRAIDAASSGATALVALLRSVVEHYSENIEDFRIHYLWSQIVGIPHEALREQIFPRAAAMFDALEAKLEADRKRHRVAKEVKARHLGNVAWTLAIGILTRASLIEGTTGQPTRMTSDLVEEASRTLLRAVLAK